LCYEHSRRKLTNMAKITTTIYINNDTTNPLAVDVTITAEKQPLNVWDYEIKVNRVELVVGDKEGIDITKQLTARAMALITAQVANEEDQINDALNEAEDENENVDQRYYNKAS
jgi:hypothetical protein